MTAKLILTVLVVNLVLPSRNLGHPMSDQGATSNFGASIVNADVQQNFHSLIESVAKSDSRSEVYRGALQDNVAKGQQAFDAMKDEIQITQKRNVDRRRDHVESGMHHSGNVSPVKRIAKERAPSQDPLMLEDLFVKEYGNDRDASGVWPFAREHRCDHQLLAEVCNQAHCFTRRPDGEVKDSRYFANRTLSFRQEKYKPILADMIFYTVPYNESELHYYNVMKGLKSDCIFYLHTPGTEFPPKHFLISDHVCTIQFYRTLHLNSRMLPYMHVDV